MTARPQNIGRVYEPVRERFRRRRRQFDHVELGRLSLAPPLKFVAVVRVSAFGRAHDVSLPRVRGWCEGDL